MANLDEGGKATKNLPKIPNITPKRSLEGGFEDIGDVLDEVKTPSPGQQPKREEEKNAPLSASRHDQELERMFKRRAQDEKVRKVSPDWLKAWRELVGATNGITKDDSRFNPTITALVQCDNAFEEDDWLAFQVAAAQVMHHVNQTD